MNGKTSAIAEAAFVERRRPDWERLEDLVGRLQVRGVRKLDPHEVALLPPLYRDVAADLSRAQAARYSAPLVEYLQGLSASAHVVLYGKPGRALASRFAAADAVGGDPVSAFPRAVRRRKGAVLLAALLFVVPLLAGYFATRADPSFAYKIAPRGMLEQLAEAYAKGFDEGRGAGEGAMMAGFYVNNNVGIALRCFALGIFGGLGSAFYLLFNGLAIGAIFGYVTASGAGENILTFVAGHTALELGAIILAGGAGLVVGWSLVAPRGRTRLDSLRAAAPDVAVIVSGAAVMLFLAAGVEAFWSGSSLPADVKRGGGLFALLLVLVYLGFAGRGSQAARGST